MKGNRRLRIYEGKTLATRIAAVLWIVHDYLPEAEVMVDTQDPSRRLEEAGKSTRRKGPSSTGAAPQQLPCGSQSP